MTAEEPITVQVLRRPSMQPKSTASQRNSLYIPNESPTPTSNGGLKMHKEAESMPPCLLVDEDEVLNGQDFLVPGLDYEVICYGIVMCCNLIKRVMFRSVQLQLRYLAAVSRKIKESPINPLANKMTHLVFIRVPCNWTAGERARERVS